MATSSWLGGTGQQPQMTGGQMYQPNPNYGQAWGQNNIATLQPGGGTYDQNMAAGAGAVPGAPGWVGNQLGWYNNTPQSSNGMNYGRWNWLNSSGSGGTAGGGTPPTPTGTPTTPTTPAQTATPGLSPDFQAAMNNLAQGYRNPQTGGTATPGYNPADPRSVNQYNKNLAGPIGPQGVNNFGTRFANPADAALYQQQLMDPLARMSLLGMNPDKSA